ncbi:type II toxin-antitoxin system PemK/MazF family toxin [Nocardia concava]|uniref:type II toxin-antitoxin system PemK/MazF family toxin n=1 Tax=Nocardia concava TaxID=257281 RepID=UPI0003006085|nr:type II toxin-antitoxin system PemK/MazF family toxin [Nocardia concava]
MRRGDLYNYRSISRTQTVLVVSADELNAVDQPITLDVTDVRPTGVRSMLAVPLPGHGYILVRNFRAADPARFADCIGQASAEVMEQLDMSLRAALDLSG